MTYIEIADELFMANMASGNEEYLTYLDIVEKVFGENTGLVRSKEHAIKSYRFYQPAKDLISKMRRTMRANKMDFETKKLENGYMGYRYPKCDESPVASLLSSQKKMRLKQLERLVKSSTGLFPDSWLADLIGSARQLSQHKAASIIGFNQNARYSYIHFVPTFFDAIERCQVVSFYYSPGFADDSVEIIFHPYFIKEYNQRWFVFGKSFDREGHKLKYAICALDRIRGNIQNEEMEYMKNTDGKSYEHYLDDIIGVTRPSKGKVEHIIIKCNDTNAANRIHTKPLHRSQKRIEEEEMDYTFSIDVIPNPELYAMLLSYGSSIKILSPASVAEEIKKRAEKLLSVYSAEY